MALAQLPQEATAGAVDQKGDIRPFCLQVRFQDLKAGGTAKVQVQALHCHVRQGPGDLLQPVPPAGDQPAAADLWEHVRQLAHDLPAQSRGSTGDNGRFHGAPPVSSASWAPDTPLPECPPGWTGSPPGSWACHCGLWGPRGGGSPPPPPSPRAEGSVLAVQMGRRRHHDEELAAGAVRVPWPGHGQHTGGVAQIVLGEAVAGELALDVVAGAAHAVAVGTAALDHEAGDHPVEDQAVIKAPVGQGDEIVDRVGGLLGVQLAGHDGAVFHGDGNDGVLHFRHVYRFLSLRGAVDLPAGVPLGGGRPLVVVLFALAQADLQLHPGVLEIHRQGHQSVPRPAGSGRGACGSPACASAAAGTGPDPC